MRDAGEIERLPILLGKRFGEPRPGPRPDDPRERRHTDENPRPIGEFEDRLPERRRENGHDHEHDEDRAHQPSHRVAFEAVANHGCGHHAKPRYAHALDPAQDEQRLVRRRDRAQQRDDDIEREADEQDAPPPVPVGQAARHQRASTGSEQIDAHNQLSPVGIVDTERHRDFVERGEHAVDRQSAEAHHCRHKRDEFEPAHYALRAVAGGDGSGHHAGHACCGAAWEAFSAATGGIARTGLASADGR